MAINSLDGSPALPLLTPVFERTVCQNTVYYPPLPVLAPRASDEPAWDFGFRAFQFLVTERTPASLLDTETLELALHASIAAVTGRETALAALDTFHAVRRDILTVVTRRQQQAAREARLIEALAAPVVAADDAPRPPGGARVPRPVPAPILPSSGANAAF